MPLLAMIAAALLRPGPADAEQLPSPAGQVILTIAGEITTTNAEGRAEFDLEMLARMSATVVRTITPWAAQPIEFEGVLMRDILALVGSYGETVKATALNDYVVEIPVSDFATEDVILAVKKDNEYMTVREKGPLWIIYPLDDDLSDPVKHDRMVWQLRRLDVR